MSKKGSVASSPALRNAKWAATLLLLVAASIFAAHHVMTFMSPKSRRGGQLMSAGFYGQKIHVYCKGISEDTSKPVFVFHHDNHVTCINYSPLQDALFSNGHPSCCVERPGFGLSPLFEFNQQGVNLKNDVSHLVEAVVQMVGEEHTFISVGHGAGASYAWAANRLVPKMHRGLILMDGITQAAFKSCPEMTRAFSVRPSPVDMFVQQSGLRRLLAHFDLAGLRPHPPLVPAELAPLNRAMLLTDKMFSSTATAVANTLMIASQLHVISEPTTPAVFLVSNTAKSKVEGFDWVDCANENGLKFVQRYFKKNLVIPVRNHGHWSMTAATEEILKAASFVLNPDVQVQQE